MTTTELLALPDDGVARWLDRGVLREGGRDRRDRRHSQTSARLAQLLGDWLDGQPEPRGEVFGGSVGCRLERDPDTTFGIDLVYLSWRRVADQTAAFDYVEGIPTLAVDIVDHQDDELEERIGCYRRAGVPLIWIIVPRFQTVTVYRPNQLPESFNAQHELLGDPHLPGLRLRVASIFAR